MVRGSIRGRCSGGAASAEGDGRATHGWVRRGLLQQVDDGGVPLRAGVRQRSPSSLRLRAQAVGMNGGCRYRVESQRSKRSSLAGFVIVVISISSSRSASTHRVLCKRVGARC